MQQPRARSFDIQGRTIAALEWGEPCQPLMLALHGWLDNAASFALLAPRLEGFRVVALDMAGHGLSDWRSSDSAYPIWSYVEDLYQVSMQLQAEKFALLGHSLGAGIASLFAASWPEKVTRLGLIENLGPLADAEAEADFAQILRSTIEQHQLPAKEVRARAFEAWVRSRSNTVFSVPEHAARLLMQRNTRETDAGLYGYACDPRLRLPSLIRLSEAQVRSALAALIMPVKLITGQAGLKRPLTQERIKVVPKISQVELPGGHHLHMEESEVEAVAKELNAFYAEMDE
jgi:pimeloyl-ACP methyl ester carboxylesterase